MKLEHCDSDICMQPIHWYCLLKSDKFCFIAHVQWCYPCANSAKLHQNVNSATSCYISPKICKSAPTVHRRMFSGHVAPAFSNKYNFSGSTYPTIGRSGRNLVTAFQAMLLLSLSIVVIAIQCPFKHHAKLVHKLQYSSFGDLSALAVATTSQFALQHGRGARPVFSFEISFHWPPSLANANAVPGHMSTTKQFPQQ